MMPPFRADRARRRRLRPRRDADRGRLSVFAGSAASPGAQPPLEPRCPTDRRPRPWAPLRSGRGADIAKERLFADCSPGGRSSEVAEASRAFALAAPRARGCAPTQGSPRVAPGQGHDVVLVSASPELYVARDRRGLHAHGAVATRLAVDPQGRLTGRYQGKNCRGTEKLLPGDSWMRSEGQRDSRSSTGALRLRQQPRRPAAARGPPTTGELRASSGCSGGSRVRLARRHGRGLRLTAARAT